MIRVALSELLAPIIPISESVDLPVTGFSLDSRQLSDGIVFIAVKGTHQHGLAYTEQAIERGAAAILHDGLAETLLLDQAIQSTQQAHIPLLAVPDLAEKLGGIARRFYQGQRSCAGINVIGVTGTDGKTSTTHFIAEALQAANQSAAVMGTLGIGQPGNLQQATHTTPDAIHVQQHLYELEQIGFDVVAMEVSSHALDQGRVNAVPFSIAVLTNLTRDHLDYHGSVEAYANAKRKLFRWPALKYVVLNYDDALGRELAVELLGSGVELITYGTGARTDYPTNSLVATEARFDQAGIYAKITSPWGQGVLEVPVLGSFNLDNSLAALGVLLASGLAFSIALEALKHVYTVPGRMQRVTVPDRAMDTLIVVDYAHTPDALKQVLQAARAHTRHRLFCVFGCGGDRDTGKRPLMAAIAEQYADSVIVTDDNPRTEAPAKIFADIRAGFRDPQAVQFEHDRACAIRLAIQAAKAGDTVIIAGKGHETVQLIAGQALPFDDRVQAALALEECAA